MLKGKTHWDQKPLFSKEMLEKLSFSDINEVPFPLGQFEREENAGLLHIIIS